MKDQFLRWWKSQTPHDRKLWIAIAACVLIGLFYFCVYHPLVSWQDRNYTKNTRLKSDVKWISTNYQALEKISSAAKKNSAAGGTSIQSAVEKTVKISDNCHEDAELGSLAGLRLARRRGVPEPHEVGCGSRAELAYQGIVH